MALGGACLGMLCGPQQQHLGVDQGSVDREEREQPVIAAVPSSGAIARHEMLS